MRVSFIMLSLFVFVSGCKSDNVDKKGNTELLKDGSISATSAYWKFRSRNDYKGNIASNDFIGSISNNQFTSGPSSLMISRQQFTEEYASAAWYQEILSPSIPKGSNLTLRAKIRTENIEEGGIEMTIVGTFDNDKGENYFLSTFSQKIGGTSDFKEYTLRFDNYTDTFAPTEKLYVNMILTTKNKGTVYIDDISLTIE